MYHFYQFKRLKVKVEVTGCQTPQVNDAYRTYHSFHVDLSYCQRLRRSAAGRTAAYRDGTRRHFFLF